MCRRRSPLAAIAAQLVDEFVQPGDRPTWHRRRQWSQGRRQPALPDRLGQQRILHPRLAPLAGWHQLCDDALSIGHQDRLARGGEPNIFAQSVLEDPQADSSHDRNVAT